MPTVAAVVRVAAVGSKRFSIFVGLPISEHHLLRWSFDAIHHAANTNRGISSRPWRTFNIQLSRPAMHHHQTPDCDYRTSGGSIRQADIVDDMCDLHYWGDAETAPSTYGETCRGAGHCTHWPRLSDVRSDAVCWAAERPTHVKGERAAVDTRTAVKASTSAVTEVVARVASCQRRI